MYWIHTNYQLPEDDESLVINPLDDITPLRTKKLLVITDTGSVVDNFRVKMMVGEKDWVWFMNIDDEKITYWTVYEEPSSINSSPIEPREGLAKKGEK